MAKISTALRTWRLLRGSAFGRWLFIRVICLKAPYFVSISPRLERLEPGACEGWIRRRRRITNHLGTIHAIALCNLAELTGGLMTDASLPVGMRWIPKGMQVRYLKKAAGRVDATATLREPLHTAAEGYEATADVVIRSEAGEAVFGAQIAMWISPRARKGQG